MGVVLGPIEQYFGFRKAETYERKEGEWDLVVYELRKFVGLLIKGNPNVLSLLWLPEDLIIEKNFIGEELIAKRDLFTSKAIYKTFIAYANSQLRKMTSGTFEGYMGDKRKQLVEKFGYDTKNSAHCIRLLKQGIEFLTTGELIVKRPDSAYLLDIKDGKFTLSQIQDEARRLQGLIDEAFVRSKLPEKIDFQKIEKWLVKLLSYQFLNGG
jgi:predicted nucleotidyltransferase